MIFETGSFFRMDRDFVEVDLAAGAILGVGHWLESPRRVSHIKCAEMPIDDRKPYAANGASRQNREKTLPSSVSIYKPAALGKGVEGRTRSRVVLV